MRQTARLAACFILALALLTFWLTPNGNLFPEPRVSDFAQFLSRTFYAVFLALGFGLTIFGPLQNGETRGARLLFVLGVTLLAMGIESGFERIMWEPRPGWRTAVGESSGFPSGHATASFAMAFLLATLFPRLAIPAFFAAFLVGYSRVEVTAHYPHQVVAGATFGSLVSFWCALAREKFLEKRLAKPQTN